MADLKPLLKKLVRVYVPVAGLSNSYFAFGIVSAIDEEYIVLSPFPPGPNGGIYIIQEKFAGVEGRTLIPLSYNPIITELPESYLTEHNIPQKKGRNK